MQLTDRTRLIKIVLVVAAAVITAASLVVSHYLVRDLANEEHGKMRVWAEAMHSLAQADENTDLSIVLSVINSNNTIPVIVADEEMNVQDFRNISISASTAGDSVAYLRSLAREAADEGNVIKVEVSDDGDYINVYYAESVMLRRLSYYPYVVFTVVLVFFIVSIVALFATTKAEQNKVWVGLSKETAHQLGTPISSLMAWTEILKETYPDDSLLPEMEMDVKRLERIAERFSKIGSVPEAKLTSLNEVIDHVVEYMDRRTSKKVEMKLLLPVEPVEIKMNASLFEWVIENLCKNAVDAMEGSGRITIMMQREGNRVAIEVSDTGKGIARKNLQSVFKPGFTTKKRGWGLGLSLAKRIVEEYHRGRIYVKSSEVGKGTTFRIEMPN